MADAVVRARAARRPASGAARCKSASRCGRADVADAVVLVVPAAPARTTVAAPVRPIEQSDARRWTLLGTGASLPCNEPPWGELIAVSANTGDIAWRVPLGEFEELEKKGIKTGTASLGGGVTTAGNLVFIGATIDGFFRAFDARNGKELWKTKLEVPAHAIPATYMGRTASSTLSSRPVAAGFFAARRLTPWLRSGCRKE